MYYIAEYDSGTVYDETVEEEEVPEDIPEYYDEGAAEEEAYASAEQANAVVTGDDLVHGAAHDDGVDKEDAAAPGTQEGGEEQQPLEYPEDDDEAEVSPKAESKKAENVMQEAADPSALNQELHPPSDEYYEDPEFSQQVADEEEVEPYEEQYDDQEEEAGADDSESVQDYTEGEAELDLSQAQGNEAEESEAGLTIDPDAPLDEVADQIEDFEEGTLEREDDVAAEARAARREFHVPTIAHCPF